MKCYKNMALNEDRLRLNSQRSLAAQFLCGKYSREKRYLIILSRDLRKEFEAFNHNGIEKSKEYQYFYDFICDFERLRDLMAEFRWNKDVLAENGIDFKSYRNLYFAVA